MDPRRPSRPTSIGYGIVTFLLGLTLVGGAYAIGYAALGAVQGDHNITLDRTAPPDQLASLPPEIKPTDQCCAVTQTINDATPLQLLLWTASDLIVLALGFVALWQLRGLLGSVRQGDPFMPPTSGACAGSAGCSCSATQPSRSPAPYSKRAWGRPCPRPSRC